MIPPKQLNKRQLDILLAGCITWHTPDTKSVRPFHPDASGVLTTLANGDPICPSDNDFQALITYGYIEPIDAKSYILTNEANDAFKELTTIYLNRSAGVDVGRGETKTTISSSGCWNEIESNNKGDNMKYQKPVLVAKSQPQRSFVAGCPEKTTGGEGSYCNGSSHKKCEIAK